MALAIRLPTHFPSLFSSLISQRMRLSEGMTNFQVPAGGASGWSKPGQARIRPTTRVVTRTMGRFPLSLENPFRYCQLLPFYCASSGERKPVSRTDRDPGVRHGLQGRGGLDKVTA